MEITEEIKSLIAEKKQALEDLKKNAAASGASNFNTIVPIPPQAMQVNRPLKSQYQTSAGAAAAENTYAEGDQSQRNPDSNRDKDAAGPTGRQDQTHCQGSEAMHLMWATVGSLDQ